MDAPNPPHPQTQVTQAGPGKAAAEQGQNPKTHHEKPGC